MKNVVALARPFDDPVPAEVNDLDLITFFFFYHDTTYMTVDRAAMNKKLFAALKPGGFLVIADHSAKPGDGISVGKTLHRIEESTLQERSRGGRLQAGRRGRLPAPSGGHRATSADFPAKVPVDEFVLKFQKPNDERRPLASQ